MRRAILFLTILTLLVLCAVVSAEPKVTMTATVAREAINLTIYNPIVSLIQERREISLAQGLNEFRVNWAGVTVNRDSVRLVLLDGAQEVTIRDVVWPANAASTVIWHLDAKRAGSYPISLSYYVGGFSWDADYLLTVDDQEKNLWLKAWANITNGSGEDYQNANVRLVLGDVRVFAPRAAQGAIAPLNALVSQAPPGPSGAVDYRTGLYGAAGAVVEAERPQFAALGFAEYAFYTLERPETLDSGDTKRIILASSAATPLRKMYTYDRELFGPNVVMQYWIENKKEHNLGNMPPGLVRAYRQEKDGRLSLLGEDAIPYIPLGETAKIYLGNARDIVVETAQTDYQRTDEQWAPDKSRLIRYVDESGYKVTIKNRKTESAELIVRQHYPDDAKLLAAEPKPDQPRLGVLEWKLKLAAGETRELTYRTSRTVYNK